MGNLASTFVAEQMESTTAGKCVSSTSWSFLAVRIQLNKMQFFQFLGKPLMGGIGGFALQYFCNDLNGLVQRQGYGVITYVPYIVFSIMFTGNVLWWIIYGRRLESCQDLETLPRHRQDIQTIETQEIQRMETTQAGDVQMDQALQGFLIRPEEFCTLMDYWFSARLGEMTRDEALGKMKQLAEIGNHRTSHISIESTADETRAVMNGSLETRGDGSGRLSAGSIINGTHSPVFPNLCPGAANSNSQARSLSHDGLVLKIPQNVDVGELGEIYDANLPGCRELHRRIEIGPQNGGLREVLASQILRSLRMAWTLDKDSTIQLGSFAIFKYTDLGVKCWMLQEGWTPTIFDIHRSSRNFFAFLTGERANWTVRGVNLQHATLRVATAEKSENVTISHHFKTENGVDVVLFKEPPSLPIFLDGVFISASNMVEVERGVPLKLHSQALHVQRAFWISVVDAFMPRPWTLGIITIMSLLFHYFVAWQFAIVVPIIVATYAYLLSNLVPPQGTDVPIEGLAPVVEELNSCNDSYSHSRTLSEGKLTEIDTPIRQEDGADENEGSTPPLEDSSSFSKSSTTTDDAKMGIGTLKTESITNPLRQAPVKEKKRRKRPSKKPPTQIIEASPDQFRATMQEELTGMKPAMSVPRGQPVVDNPLHTELTTPVTVGGLPPVVEEFSDATNSNSRTIQDGKLVELHMPMGKQGGDLPVGGSTSLLRDSGSVSESSSTTHGQDHKPMKLDQSIEEQDEDGPLPGIQDLQIVGHAVLGGRLTACGHSINGTTLCMFQWVRHYPNGTVMYIEGAAEPEYIVTADDHNTMLALECVPMDERNRRGELVNVFANESKLITCGEMLQNIIDRYNAILYASFDVKFLVDGSLPEEYWESTLTLIGNRYKLKRNNTAKTEVINEEYLSDVSIQILVGHLSQCVIKSHKGRSYYLEFPSSRSRDVGVLTFRSFQKMAKVGRHGSGKEAATRNRQQTGESQRQSGDAKYEAFEVKKPQEHVSTNKNKYVPQVWKLPELPKQDLTSPGSLRVTRIPNLVPPQLSLAKGGVVSRGGFTNSGKGVKSIGNRRNAHTETTSQSDDANDEGSTPPLEDSSSESKSSTTTHDAKMGTDTLKTESITNPLRQAPQVKEKKKYKRPFEMPPTQTIKASPADQFPATVPELTGVNPAMSVPRGQPIADNPLHTDLITPVAIGGLAPVVAEFSDVTNSSSRTIPEGKSTEMDMRMRKQGGDLPVGAEEQVIELKRPQQHPATSKNKYVPQAHELSEPQEPTLRSRSGTRISDGDLPFEGRTQSAEAFSTIPGRMWSQSAVVDDLTKTDEPIDKQSSRVSSPSAVEEGFTTTDDAIDKQGGDLTVDFGPDHWSVDPITYGTMCDPAKCNDGVTYDRWTIINNRIRRSPFDRSLTTFFIACDDVDVRRRLFQELPEQEVEFRRLRKTYREKALQSARALNCEDAIEMLNNVLVWAPSDTECQAELARVMALVNQGSSSLERQPQKTDEIIDKRPSHVSSPSAVEQSFTTTDEATHKQEGGLPYQRWKEQKNLKELEVRLLELLEEKGPTRTLELAKNVGLVTCRDVNRPLYDLKQRNLVVKVNDVPAVWQLKEPGMKKTG